jgi:hypothetical protein
MILRITNPDNNRIFSLLRTELISYEIQKEKKTIYLNTEKGEVRIDITGQVHIDSFLNFYYKGANLNTIRAKWSKL